MDIYGSGSFFNPGKGFFLKLAAEYVRTVNSYRDKNGLTYARKAMIRTGISRGLDGSWSEGKLSDDLQAIIAKYRTYFDGEPVLVEDVETESETEDEV